MSGRWQSWLPVSGIVFAALMVAAVIVVGDSPGDSDREILEYYTDDGNRNEQLAGFVLIAIGLLFFLVFLASLWSALRLAEGEPGPFSALALIGGATFSALMLSSNALFVAIAEATDEDEFRLDPNLARVTGNIGYMLFVSALAAGGLMIAGTSILAIRTRLFPAWVGWVGLALALALVVIGFAFVPVFGLVAWVLLISLLLLRPAFSPRPVEPAV